MNLTFLVRGKEADVIEAKRRIIASFQTQVHYFNNVIIISKLIILNSVY